MVSVTMKTASGADAGTVELPDDIFGIEPNVPLMHQVVTAQRPSAALKAWFRYTRRAYRSVRLWIGLYSWSR